MAGFATHITVSTTVGVGYGWWLHAQYGLPWTSASVAGGLCSLAGMLPDLDSDNGIPARETISFTAAIVPMLLVRRLQRFGFTLEQMILFGAPVYAAIRFGLGTLFKEFTVHRGMFHSIPAMLIAGLLTFLISDSEGTDVRVLKGIAVSLGYLSHLVLDEIWSVEVGMTGTRLKKSSGTALKFFGRQASANAMCWGLLLLIGFVAFQDSGLSGVPSGMPPQLAAPARPPQWPRSLDPGRQSPERPQRPDFRPVPDPQEQVYDNTALPRDDAFEPLPDWPPRRNAPLPAISERGVITPRIPRDQARFDRYDTREQ